MKTFIIIMLSLLVGGFFGWYVTTMEDNRGNASHTQPANPSHQNKPLYWVAPMDDSYRRDKPGKSPMGMDLVPVYAKHGKASNDSNSVSIPSQVQQNMGVKTATAEVGQLDPVLRTIARATFNEDNLVHVHPRVEGWIDTLYVKDNGQQVNKGDPVYTLYSPQLVSAQEDYLIALKRGNSQLIKGAKERLVSLQLSDALIKKLAKTRVVSQSVTFYAPRSGVVENLNVREGAFVKPGMQVISIAPLNTVWVIIDIFEAYINKIAVGQQVSVFFEAVPGKKWHANIEFIYPRLHPKTGTLMARLTLLNAQGSLRPDMLGEAVIHIASDKAKPLVKIPREAVIKTSGEERVVVRVGMEQFRSVVVTTGPRDENYVAILDGISPGDEVVTSAQFLIDSESSKRAAFSRISNSESRQEITPSNEQTTPHTSMKAMTHDHQNMKGASND